MKIPIPMGNWMVDCTTVLDFTNLGILGVFKFARISTASKLIY